MLFLRLIVYLMPQLLLFLFVAGSKDMLGGWNHTDGAMGTLLVLFFLCPISALTLIGAEIRHFWKGVRHQRPKRALLIVLSLLVFIEVLAINYYLLTQVRM